MNLPHSIKGARFVLGLKRSRILPGIFLNKFSVIDIANLSDFNGNW